MAKAANANTPCPWCGCFDQLDTVRDEYDRKSVHCFRCAADGPAVSLTGLPPGKSQNQEAWDRWNNRVVADVNDLEVVMHSLYRDADEQDETVDDIVPEGLRLLSFCKGRHHVFAWYGTTTVACTPGDEQPCLCGAVKFGELQPGG